MTSPRPPRSDQTATVAAGFLGWMLDAFDFFLVVMTLTAIAKEFGKSDAAIALSLTLTLAFRPVGAFFFGLLADRYGRKIPLMVDLVFYSIVEVLSGLAPNYTTFLILRALFGIGMGAEWGVGASLVMEKVPPRLRGVMSGLLQQGYAAGYLLAALCYLFVFPRWGWRPLFFIGGLPALLALFVRARVQESDVWRETRHETWTHLGRAIASNWKLFLYITGLMAMMNMVSHGTQDMYPTFLERDWHLGPTTRAAITAFSQVGALCGGVLCGLYSDRLGRRRMIALALLGAILAIPLWAFAPGAPLLWLGAFIMQFFVQGAWGVIPAHINELAPDGVRGFLPGFAYQCGVAIASQIPHVQALFAAHRSYAQTMALSAALVFIVGAVAALSGPERRGVAFGRGIAMQEHL
jgi:MFS transporter, SHS family, lactate transporter